MAEKEEQFFRKPRPEKSGREPRIETEIERKKRLGKESELTIAAPLFTGLKRAGVLAFAEHTPPEVDEKKGVDFVWGLEDGTHLAIQLSVAGRGSELWGKKILKIIGEGYGRPIEELKDIHPQPDLLSRRARIERVPKILLHLNWETVDGAYRRFESLGQVGSPFDFFPDKEAHEKALLIQALNNLLHFSSEKEIARRFPELPLLAGRRYETLNNSVRKFLGKEK